MLYDPDTKNFLIFLKKVLQNTKTYDIISKSRETRVLTGQKKKVATVAQSVERRIGSAEVTGPIPVSSFIEKKRKSLNERVCAFLCYGVTVLRYYDECIAMEVWMRGDIRLRR